MCVYNNGLFKTNGKSKDLIIKIENINFKLKSHKNLETKFNQKVSLRKF
jgi:pimeloyl-CoA synthetase